MTLITETGNIFKGISINLIDFGMSKRYIDKKTRKHIPLHDLDVFSGNLGAASINQLNFLSSSARDDLQSLVYMLCGLNNKGLLPGIESDHYDDLNVGFQNTLTAKLNLTPKIIAGNLGVYYC